MMYCFHCGSPDHPEGVDRDFVQAIHHIPKKGAISQYNCVCGAVAKRDLAKEIPSQSVIGATPISHSTTGKGSIAHEVEFMAGKFKTNPDGSIDKNHRPFRDTGELNAYMNGMNDLGPPVLDDNGNPKRRKDGSIIRTGAKLFKYPKGAQPSRSGVRKARPRVPNAWTDEGTMNRSGAKPSAWRP